MAMSAGMAVDSPKPLHSPPEFSFSFPQADKPVDSTPLPERRHRQRVSVNTLPAFSFNPSNTSAPSTGLTTPPLSPDAVPTTPPTSGPRNAGHRRAPSEFIGGDGKGGAGLLSTSPAKGGEQLQIPTVGPKLGPPAGRRGHAHRRSGAISCHDMQSILQSRSPASTMSLSGSAPTTPFEGDGQPFFTPSHQRRTTSDTSLPVLMDRTPSSEMSDEFNSSPRRPVSRTRVGFADRVEYIRPLSIISSETESSMSTIRGHSVTNSLSSITSATPSSPHALLLNRPGSLCLSRSGDGDSGGSPFRFGGAPLYSPGMALAEDAEIIANTPASPLSPPPELSPSSETMQKRRSFGWWDSRKQTSAPRSPIPTSTSVPNLVPAAEDFSSVPVPAIPIDIDADNQRKPRKVRSWTQSLRTKKTKIQSPQLVPADTMATSPMATSPFDEALAPMMDGLSDLDTDFIPDFDEDTTITLVSTSAPSTAPVSPNTRQSKARRRFEEENASPVIDLDAALGPFNTPASPRSRQRARHSMHAQSSASQNHRRTESAPELAPFERATTKKVQSPMEDVFEEEEEEDKTSAPKTITPGFDDYLPSPPSSPFSENMDTSRRGSDSKSPMMQPLRFSHPRHRRRTSTSTTGSAAMPVEVVEPYEEPRAMPTPKNTISPMTDAFPTKPPSLMTTLGLPSPTQMIMTPDTIGGSSFSGRDYPTSSQISLDTPRLGTATSSIGTDSRSIFFGDAGPEIRMSVDDVPSLSSSRSCRSGVVGPSSSSLLRPHSAFTTTEENTAVTFDFASTHNVARKRASMASLSRLMGGGFVEKSKLSMESRPPSQHSTLTTGRTEKKKRLSKLMQFFKPRSPTRGLSS